jgi:uncharacterized membrane protein YdjX (TVP38/TMEM64 family)
MTRLKRFLPLLFLLLIVSLSVYLSQLPGFDPKSVAERLRALGFWSAPAYVAAFVLGLSVALPGMAFVAAARVLFGGPLGFVLAYVGALAAVTVPFWLARLTRKDRPPTRLRWQRLQRLLDRVEHQPIRSVALLRLVLFLSPPLNYALAFTKIRARSYVLGSALGLAPGIGAVVLLIGCVPWW